jgi:hypothetical protein
MSISLCVERGGDVDKKDARRDAFSAGAGVATCTPLFAAVWQEEHDAVRALLAAGADPREGDGEGRAPLSLVDRGSADHTENTRRIREMLLDAVAKVEKSEKAARSVSMGAETFGDSGNGDDGGDARRISALEEARALRLERADAQARRAAAWVRKREARARAAETQAVEEEEDEDEDDSDREEGSAPDAFLSEGFESGADDDFATGAVSSARANEERRSLSGGSDAEIVNASRRARVSLALRRRAARGAKRVANALAAFRDASRAARDAERRSTVMLRPADVEAREVETSPPAVVGVAKSSASSSAEKRKKTPNVSAGSGSARSRRGAEKHSEPAPSPTEVSRLVALADDARVALRRALHARAFEIRNSLADLPDALERLRARAVSPEAPAEETKYSLPRDGRDARRSKPGVAKRFSAFASSRSSRTRSSIGSFGDFEDSDEDDGAFNGRARVESRATAAVLGSE